MKQPPRCIQGSAKAWAGPTMLFSPAQMAWPRGSGQRQDGRTAGRQALPQGHRRISAPELFPQTRRQQHLRGAQAPSGDQYHLAFILPPGYSQLTTTDSSSLPPVCAGQPCVVLSASFRRCSPPRHSRGSPAARSPGRKEATNPLPSAFVGKAL